MPVGGAVDQLIVDNCQRTVAGEVDVKFDPIRAKLEGVLERGHRVFGTVAHRAAVADHPDAPALLDQTLSERHAFSGCLSHTIRIVAGCMRSPPFWTFRSVLLRIWRDVPFPGWMRHGFLRVLNPSFMVGAMALIQDDQGRILFLEHTYR